MQFYLVRHGESEVNITHEFSHRIVDKGLTSKGRIQAQQVANFFTEKEIDAIFSSPLKRAYETAEIIAAQKKLPVSILEEFREINVGNLEKVPPSDETWNICFSVLAAWQHQDHIRSFPEGENHIELLSRAKRGLLKILQSNFKTVVLVAHGGIFMHTLPYILENLTPVDLENRDWPNVGITIVDLIINNHEPRGELIEYGIISHLSGEAAILVSGVPDKKI